MPASNPTVEVFYSGAWHDITALNHVRVEDPITIARQGSVRIGTPPPPSKLTLTIDNTAGRYSPRNPSSPLWGLIGRNTPIRVSVGGSVRFVGEVEAWPTRWDVSGTDVYTPIVAYGILQRLNMPGTIVKTSSALRRAITAGPAPLAFWAMDDGYLAKGGQLTSGSGTGMTLVTINGRSQFGVADMAPWLEPGVTLDQDSVMSARVAGMSATPARFVFDYMVKSIPGQLLIDLFGNNSGAGLRWRMYLTGGAFTDVTLDVDNNGAQISHNVWTDQISPGIPGFLYDGKSHHIRLDAAQNAGNVDFTVYVDGVARITATLVGITLAAIIRVRVSYPTLGSLSGQTVVVSSIAVWEGTPLAVATAVSASAGWAGETMTARVNRLCTEEGITGSVLDLAGGPQSNQLGPQKIATIVELLVEATDADNGIMYESRGVLGLSFRTGRHPYNKAPTIALNYAAGGEITPPLQPVEDTQHIANDVTVKRYLGGQRQAVKNNGPLNVQPPPDGVGRYPIAPELTLFTDDDLLQMAAWLRFIGTWDEARYEVVNLDLAEMIDEGKTVLAGQAAALDIGDRISIVGLPAWVPPDSVELRVTGYVEVIESHGRTLAVSATPYGPYDVLQLETDVTTNRSRIPAAQGATTLNGTLTTTATSVGIVSAKTRWIDKATYPTMFPFDIIVNGERMRVTDCVGTTLFQTFTVVRSINGVVKVHDVSETVQLFRPPVIAR